MDAINFIQEHGNVEDLLQHYKVEYTYKGNTIRSSCPIHGGDNKDAFVFNLENKLWWCHTGCKMGGDIVEFVKQIENIENLSDAIHKTAEILKLDIENLEIKQRKPNWLKETLKLMKQIKKVSSTTIDLKEYSIDDQELFNINSYRQFDRDILSKFNIKYAKEYKYINKDGKEVTLKNKIVIPIYFNKKLIGVTLRRTSSRDYAKWFHLPVNMNTGNILYNLDNVERGKPIIVVEGIWDVINFHMNGFKNVVATFGSNLSKSQEILLMKKTYSLWLAYDNDIAGQECTKKVIEKLKHKMDLEILVPPVNDFGECTKEQILNSIDLKMKWYEWGTNK